MSTFKNAVSIQPHFQIHPGKNEEAEAILQRCVEAASQEEKCHYYNFTFNGDRFFCREAYAGGEGALAHMENVGALIDELLQVCDLDRIEVHGPAEELEKLKEPMAALNPQWFEQRLGVEK